MVPGNYSNGDFSEGSPILVTVRRYWWQSRIAGNGNLAVMVGGWNPIGFDSKQHFACNSKEHASLEVPEGMRTECSSGRLKLWCLASLIVQSITVMLYDVGSILHSFVIVLKPGTNLASSPLKREEVTDRQSGANFGYTYLIAIKASSKSSQRSL